MLKVRSNVRARLCAVAVLMAVVAGCGGGGGGGPGPSAPPSGPPAPVSRWGTFTAASVVLGQTGFDQEDPTGTPTTAFGILGPGLAATPDNRLFVVNSGPQVVVFNQYDTTNGPTASDFETTPGDPGIVRGISAQGSKLIVVKDHQVRIYNSAPTVDDSSPDVVGGETDPGCSALLMREPSSAYLTPLGQLIVADTDNHRVLIWHADSVPDAGVLGEADVVLGQKHMETCTHNDSDGNGITDFNPTEQTMFTPTSVWSDGVRLVVADEGNHRVLIWTAMPSEDFAPANLVLGQPNPNTRLINAGGEPSATTFNSPRSVDVSAEGELAVADEDNNRVLIWRAFPERNGQAADDVLGQRDFVRVEENDGGTAPTAKTLADPRGVRFHERNLIVTDGDNRRVLIWRALN